MMRTTGRRPAIPDFETPPGMCRLSDVPYEKLAVGQRVISATSKPGQIRQLPKPGEPIRFGSTQDSFMQPCPEPTERGGPVIVIDWFDGTTTAGHLILKRVLWYGEIPMPQPHDPRALLSRLVAARVRERAV